MNRDEQKRVDRLVDSFIARVRQGEQVDIERFLDGQPEQVKLSARPLLEAAALAAWWAHNLPPEEASSLLAEATEQPCGVTEPVWLTRAGMLDTDLAFAPQYLFPKFPPEFRQAADDEPTDQTGRG